MGQPGGPARPQFSPDGRWFWDGATWQPALSPDGRWRWNGYSWERTRGGLSTGLMALIGGGVILVFLVAMVPVVIVMNRLNTPNVAAAPSPTPASPSPTHRSYTTIPCDQLEHTQVHYHAFLQIFNQGSNVDIPTNVGHTLGCFYWLHMHTNEAGIIHVESPGDRTFTLGDFFDVWSDWGQAPQLLDGTHVGALTLTAGQTLTVYVDLGDGKGVARYVTDPRFLVLKSHEVITLEIGPPLVNPPPSYTWPPGF